MTPKEAIAVGIEDYTWFDYELDAASESIFTALDKAGFVIVPKEPRLQMTRAGVRALSSIEGLVSLNGACSCYRAMIDAYKTKTPPAGEG